MSSLKLSDLRHNYTLNELSESNVSADPFIQFEQWFKEALDAKILEPNAMVLSTSVDEQPHSRVVLLKELSTDGFVFFTNYKSGKGKEMTVNAKVALNFFWGDLQRQIRIEGAVTKIIEAESDTYFNSRPRESQLGAWVSEQSQKISDRTILENRQAEFEQMYPIGVPVPRPAHWGGLCVTPNYIEFWQGRPSRLHDRIAYTMENNVWTIGRLSP